ncbi:MerR family transcriptional regulator [Paenalkalicoccus suaedae]|uniref:MerR family transcriptional regulator n=1 Tax=Paenalkalicoccus suaedae TaxID=2592382 RepID=A0A859FG04_9BACI|nr:MerR family transcriptional regulator [Paenalkalicoccus suaedae]QKS71135.1 MerR family transcriptional regulator [Paenalkalicoccus suaedae]
MTKVFKTREVAQLLDVDPTTVMRWMKSFSLHANKNEAGHYEIPESSVSELVMIKEKLASGSRLEEILMQKRGRSFQEYVEPSVIEEKLEKLLFRLETIDRQVQAKADESYAIRTQHHRKELDDINRFLEELSLRINRLETMQTDVNHEEAQTHFKKRFASLFSF